MSQMTIFEAIEKTPTPEPQNTEILHRCHIVKFYEDDVEVLVGTAIPGRQTVRIVPTKLNIGIQLDQERHNRVMKKGIQDLSYIDYKKWLSEHGFEERGIKK